MKKISMLITNLAGGGAERVNLDLAHEFKKLDHEVEFVLCEASGVFLKEAKSSFKIVDLDLKSLFKVPKKLAAYFDTAKPDAVIVSMWGLTAVAPIARLFSKHKPKLLLVEHNALINQYSRSPLRTKVFLKLSTMLSYRLADYVGGVSSGVVSDLAKLSCRPINKFEVLYNPIPLPVADEMSNTISLKWKGAKYKLLNVGSFKEQKNHELLIRAFYRFKLKSESVLVLLGEGKLEDDLKRLVEELGLVDRVIFSGFSKNPSPFYLEADLFVLSSIREGLPTVLIEALGHGLPIVSTDCPYGPNEILKNGKLGILVPVGDEVALADAMLQSLNKKHNTEKLIKRAKDFAPEVSAKRYLKLLDL